MHDNTTHAHIAGIDRTLLTEALDVLNEGGLELDYWEKSLADAARLLLDFPTDQQVREFVRGYEKASGFHIDARYVMAGLEAVRDTMIGDNQ